MKKTKIKIYFVLATLLVSVLLGNLYINNISLPTLSYRTQLVNSALKGEAKADYLYAMYSIALIHKFLTTKLSLNPLLCFVLIDFLGIVFLCLCGCWFLIRLSPNPYSWFSGLLWLLITSPLLFKKHLYHPSDFYGTGLMFLILISAKEQRHWRLGILCFLSGMFWEKTLFVPLIFFFYQIRIFEKINSLFSLRPLRPLRNILIFISRRARSNTVGDAYMRPLQTTSEEQQGVIASEQSERSNLILKSKSQIFQKSEIKINGLKQAIQLTLPSIIATLFWYISWRLHFPEAQREYYTWIDFYYRLKGGLSDWILWLTPIGIIICDIIINKRRIDPFWFYWLLYLPLLLGVITYYRGYIDELRSFWIIQPIFIGLIGNWVESVITSNRLKI